MPRNVFLFLTCEGNYGTGSRPEKFRGNACLAISLKSDQTVLVVFQPTFFKSLATEMIEDLEFFLTNNLKLSTFQESGAKFPVLRTCQG